MGGYSLCRKRDWKMLLLDALDKSKTLGWTEIYLASEPGAVSFYEKFGGIVIGKVQSRLNPKLFLPHIEFMSKS